MKNQFIFTDHALQRFRERCNGFDKEKEVSTLKAIKKSSIPNLNSSPSFKRNKNKSNIHFFSSFNNFYFVCEEKKQPDGSFSFVIITILSKETYIDEEASLMLDYYLRNKERKIQQQQDVREEKYIQYKISKIINLYEEFCFHTFSFKHLKNIHITDKYSTNHSRRVYYKFFEDAILRKNNIDKNDLFNLSNSYYNEVKYWKSLYNKCERGIIKHYKYSDKFSDEILKNVKSDFVFLKEVINDLINFYHTKLINSIYRHLKFNKPIKFKIINYIFNNIFDNETFELRKNNIAEKIILLESDKIEKQKQSSDTLYKSDFVKNLSFLGLVRKRTDLSEDKLNDLNNIINFYIFTVGKMEEFNLESFKPN